MQPRKTRKLAHLMNAPGIGRQRSEQKPQQFELLKSVKVNTTPAMKKHKACSFTPENQDFVQRTSTSMKEDRAEYDKLLFEQYGFGLTTEPRIPTALHGPNSLGMRSPRKKTSSQYVDPVASTTERITEQGQWAFVDSMDEVDSILKKRKPMRVTKETSSFDETTSTSRDIKIAKVPRVKVIAEKYIKVKNNNIEVRKLEEQIVCLEYDVFDKGTDMKEPIETMRAYFSVSTGCEKCSDDCILLNELTPELKNKMKMDNKNLENVKEKEIEIINEKIAENKSYVSDLRRVLLKKEALFAKKNKSTLDLNYLYDMAKTESPPLDHDFSKTNLLSKSELKEVKQLILAHRLSPGNHISRKTVREYTQNAPGFNRPRSRDETIIYDLLTALEQK